MKQGINLTLGRKSVDNALKKIFYITLFVFCFTVVISLSLIVYRLVLRSSFIALEEKEQGLNANLLAQQEKKDKFVETKSRLSDVKKLLAKRIPMSSRIETISQVVPNDSTVNTINGTDESIQISLESENLSSLNDLIEQRVTALAADKKKGIKKIEMRSFGLNPKTLKYSISFGVTFN